MATSTFQARLLSDLHVATNRRGGLQVVAVIYPLGVCPLPIRAYPAIWSAEGMGFKGNKVEIQICLCPDEPEQKGVFDLEITAIF